MTDTPTPFSDTIPQSDRTVPDQSFSETMLVATPAQRLDWLEEALHLAYASGALKPKRLIEKEEWESMGSEPR